MVHLSADRNMNERINANHWTIVVFLGQQMADSYWKSYRRIRSTVKKHIKEIYIDADCDKQPETSDEDSCVLKNESFTYSHEISNNDQLKRSKVMDCGDSVNFNDHLDPNSCESTVESDTDLRYSDISETDSSDSENLEDKLGSWASEFKITHVALQALLSILRVHHSFLPKDPRTLLKTKTDYNIVSITGGSYHFGIASSVINEINSRSQISLFDVDSVSLQLNIDGLPLFKSTCTQFWPILGRLTKPYDSSPFIIGLYCGDQKPGNLHEYLQQFIQELNTLFVTGITVPNTEFRFLIEISCVVCDAPARAFVKQIKGHSGYYGCDKCSQKGHWVRKMTFPEINAPLRTDSQFSEMTNEEHHSGISPFSDLPLGMVTQFPIDYMHLVCLGVVKRLLWLWIKGPLSCRQGQGFVNQVSDHLGEIKRYMPREFLRKGRALKEMDRWKATEFRQFLLYSGPVVLKNVLPSKYYKHFMLLAVAIYCLSSPFLCRRYCHYSKELLVLFVNHVGDLYGEDQYVYNIHGLVHLADDVSRFGALDTFSSFIFESFLGKLKSLVRKPNFPLQQIIRRLSEGQCSKSSKEMHVNCGEVKKKHHSGPCPRNYAGYMQFKEHYLQRDSTFLSVYQGNQCILSGENIGIIRNILSVSEDAQERILVVEWFLDKNDFYQEPLNSGDLRIYKVGRLSNNIVSIETKQVTCKCVLLPTGNEFVAIPLIHTIA